MNGKHGLAIIGIGELPVGWHINIYRGGASAKRGSR